MSNEQEHQERGVECASVTDECAAVDVNEDIGREPVEDESLIEVNECEEKRETAEVETDSVDVKVEEIDEKQSESKEIDVNENDVETEEQIANETNSQENEEMNVQDSTPEATETLETQIVDNDETKQAITTSEIELERIDAPPKIPTPAPCPDKTSSTESCDESETSDSLKNAEQIKPVPKADIKPTKLTNGPRRNDERNLRRSDRPRFDKKDGKLPTKIVIRRLPPTMSMEQFLEQISPKPNVDYIHMSKGDHAYSPANFSTVHMNFVHADDVYAFKEKFDSYVFVDGKGTEYPAVVEYATFQRIPRRHKGAARKVDLKCATIESDAYFQKFLEDRVKAANETAEDKIDLNYYFPPSKKEDAPVTPLLEYIKNRAKERNQMREDKMARQVQRRREREEKHRLMRQERDEQRKRRVENERVRREKPKSAREEKLRKVDDKEEKLTEKCVTENCVTEKCVTKNCVTEKSATEKSTREKCVTEKCATEKCATEKCATEKCATEKSLKPKESERMYERKRDARKSTVKRNQSPVKNAAPPKTNVRYYENRARTNRFDRADGKYEEKGRRDDKYKRDVKRDGKKVTPTKAIESNVVKTVDEKGDCHAENRVDDKCESDVKKKHSNEGDDPRKQRQIRNKDRPALQIYRPGMGRFSKERINTQDKPEA